MDVDIANAKHNRDETEQRLIELLLSKSPKLMTHDVRVQRARVIDARQRVQDAIRRADSCK